MVVVGKIDTPQTTTVIIQAELCVRFPCEVDDVSFSSALQTGFFRLEGTALSRMFHERLCDDCADDFMEGNRRCASGRSAGMLTLIIPRLHSATDRIRQGTA